MMLTNFWAMFSIFFRVPSVVTMRRSISCQRMPQRVTRIAGIADPSPLGIARPADD